jgi:hypothetical protein
MAEIREFDSDAYCTLLMIIEVFNRRSNAKNTTSIIEVASKIAISFATYWGNLVDAVLTISN